jgi:hypothetical protein
MRVVIPSRGRAETLHKKALALFPDATVCVGESEADSYVKAGVPSDQIVTHPDSVVGIGPLRQWILNAFDDRYLLQVDDDVKAVKCLAHLHLRTVTDPLSVRRIVVNAAHCADDIGASVFGFNQAWDVRKFQPFTPFKINSWAGGVVGFVGRKHKYDTKLLLRADIDFWLRCLLEDRVTWLDDRFSFVHSRFTGAGGNAANRSDERTKLEIDRILKRWKKHLALSSGKGTLRLVVRVQRRG